MSKEAKSKVWLIILILITAVLNFGVSRSASKVDQVNENEKLNIEQDGRIRTLEQNEERTYKALLRIEEKIDDL